MPNATDAPPCDTCDTLISFDIPVPPALSARQLRFLDAFKERRLVIAPAARLAGVHRATVYRWMAEPAFAAAVREATEAFFAAHRLKVLEEEAARDRRRAEPARTRPTRRGVSPAGGEEFPAGKFPGLNSSATS